MSIFLRFGQFLQLVSGFSRVAHGLILLWPFFLRLFGATIHLPKLLATNVACFFCMQFFWKATWNEMKDLKIKKQHNYLNHAPKFTVGILDVRSTIKVPPFLHLPLILVTRILGHRLIFMKLGPKPSALWRGQLAANLQRNCLHSCRCTWGLLLKSLDVDIIAMQQGVQPMSWCCCLAKDKL